MNTHPFITAAQAALDTHDLPDDVDSVYVARPSSLRTTPYCSVTLTGSLDYKGSGPTFAIAYAEAQAAKARDEQRKADVAARTAARKLLQDAGFDPALVAA